MYLNSLLNISNLNKSLNQSSFSSIYSTNLLKCSVVSIFILNLLAILKSNTGLCLCIFHHRLWYSAMKSSIVEAYSVKLSFTLFLDAIALLFMLLYSNKCWLNSLSLSIFEILPYIRCKKV